MKKEIVQTTGAPRPRYHIAQATKFGNLVFTSGIGPRDPSTGKAIQGPFRQHAVRTIENLKAILESAGSSLSNVLKVNGYLRDFADFDAWDEVFQEYFSENPPARMTLQMPLEHPVELDAIACIPIDEA